tara:strand:+ start:328 stop:576 length:249 start_codon:yes stop_codon:yes gene_type:complete
MLSQKAGLHFGSLSDVFTCSMGLDLLLSDLNYGNVDLRNQALHTIAVLLEHDDLVGVKIVKLKLISNILTHFFDKKAPKNEK